MSKGSARLSIFPLMWLNFPVRTTARLGAQMALEQKEFSEDGPFPGDTVDIRGLVDPGPVRRDGLAGVIVGEDEEDVGRAPVRPGTSFQEWEAQERGDSTQGGGAGSHPHDFPAVHVSASGHGSPSILPVVRELGG